MRWARPVPGRVTALAIVGLFLALAGCSAGGSSALSSGSAGPPSTAAAVHYFDGTPEEMTALFRACLADAGFETRDIGEADGFAIDTAVGQSQAYQDASSRCAAEIGQVKIAGLSQDELRERYEARTAQFDCLVAKGLLSGAPISFEVFVEDYNRSGQKVLWEPTKDARGVQGAGPSQVCPRTQSW